MECSDVQLLTPTGAVERVRKVIRIKGLEGESLMDALIHTQINAMIKMLATHNR